MDINASLIRLSSLTLAEIENQYNRASKKEKSLVAMRNGTDAKKIQEKNEAQKERRLAFGAAAEILQMQKDEAYVLPAVDYSLLGSIVEKAQSEFADPLIRREIADFRKEYPSNNIHDK